MATIKDVARLADVSITTVSHVINNTRYVSDELREKVYGAMRELHYRPNTLARSLRRGETQTIGLIVPDSSNLFFAEIAKAIEDVGFLHGYSVVLCNSDNNLEKQRAYIKTLIDKQADGVIFISAGHTKEDFQGLIDVEIPTVIVDRDIQAKSVDVILIDNDYGGYIAAQHLIDLGHTQIACVTGPSQLTPGAQRIVGYRRALQEASISINPDYIVEGDFQVQGGFDAATRLFELTPRPSAIFACNDMMAMGVLSAAHRHGLRVPQDLSIVGFDDVQMADAIFPSLTTVRQPIAQMGELAANLLRGRIQDVDDTAPQLVVLTPELVVRETTCAMTGKEK